MNPFLTKLGFKKVAPIKTTKKRDLLALLQTLHPVDGGRKLVRFGGETDGGYLIPDILDGVEACFSPGVAASSKFESECANRGLEVFLADYSVNGAAEYNSKFHFLKKYVGATSNDLYITLDDWVKQSLLQTDTDLILQIDIEGYEYETFLSVSDNLMKRFRIITGEFHFLDQLWSKSFFFLASRVFEKLLQTHTCVHLHPNAESASVKRRGITIPPLMEMTFIRKDFITDYRHVDFFPHPLDRDNVSGKSLILPLCWYR